MKFQFDNSIPIYIQLVDYLKIEIISGKLTPGSRLLSVRELALEMQVNPNTMQKALSELEDLNLIFTERTSGKYVTKDEELINKYKTEYAEELARNYFTHMENIGFSKENAILFLKEKEGKKKWN